MLRGTRTIKVDNTDIAIVLIIVCLGKWLGLIIYCLIGNNQPMATLMVTLTTSPKLNLPQLYCGLNNIVTVSEYIF